MQITFIIIFSFIFLATFICIVIFRHYKDDYVKNLDKKIFSLRIVLGFSTACTDLLHSLPFFRNTRAYSKEKKLLSSINLSSSPEKNLYEHHIRLLSYIICVVVICSFLGLAYTITLTSTNREDISDITRPAAGEGNQNMTLIADSEMYSGTIDISIDEEKYSFEEAMEIFSSCRADFDSTVLGDNVSFLHVTSPLTFPSSWGEEGISVSWYISDTDIIDYSGSLIKENISDTGSSMEIIATLSLGDFSADICYQLKVYPPEASAKASIISYINDYINSDHNLTETMVELPDNINGQAISFFQEKTVYPSLDFYSHNINNFYSYYFTGEKRT